jgi:hypothetical protein
MVNCQIVFLSFGYYAHRCRLGAWSPESRHMEQGNFSINIVTIVLIGIGVLVVFSLFTLAFYFFGESSPLQRNALGRIEAAQKPEDVLNAQRQFSSLRLAFAIVMVFVLYLFLRGAAPVQTDQAIAAFFEAFTIAMSKLFVGIKAVVSEVRTWL